jgi:hypothetical protein
MKNKFDLNDLKSAVLVYLIIILVLLFFGYILNGWDKLSVEEQNNISQEKAEYWSKVNDCKKHLEIENINYNSPKSVYCMALIDNLEKDYSTNDTDGSGIYEY